LGDCGYNQLLYPVVNQTRDLLKWLVEKLPRSEEEGAQEVLGANALMNRRIMQSLKDWKQQPWKLHFCSNGKVLRNVYQQRPFRTLPGLLEKPGTVLELFQESSRRRISIDTSVFERHALEQVRDAQYAMKLEQDFEKSQQESGAGEEKGNGESDSFGAIGAPGNSLTQNAIRSALAKALKGAAGDVGGSSTGVDGNGGSGGVGGSASGGLGHLVNGSLAELMDTIKNDYNSGINVNDTFVSVYRLLLNCFT
jgi:hypothetical protein